MALKATLCKVQLQVSDMDRNHFALHPLLLAQHPSETDERMMVRLVAYALHAGEGADLQFGQGLSSEDPDLWRKDPTGDIQLWIEVGQPDEQYIRRACGRARLVVIYNYSGRSAQVWWEKSGESLQRSKNLKCCRHRSAKRGGDRQAGAALDAAAVFHSGRGPAPDDR